MKERDVAAHLDSMNPVMDPVLSRTELWMTSSPAASPTASTHRHIVGERSATSACAITMLPRNMWRRDTQKTRPPCPVCVARHTGQPDPEGARRGRLVVEASVSFFTGRTEIAERYVPSPEEKVAAVRDQIRAHVSGAEQEHVEALVALVESGLLTVRVTQVNVDKDGGYEGPEGDCLREVHEQSMRTVTRMAFTTGLIEPDGTTYTRGTS